MRTFFSKMSKTFPFWMLTIAAIIGLVVSQLIQDGGFLDGMLYTSVSYNLAEGRGTFWDPHFSKTILDSFHEQPPLYFGLLALFYKVLGTSIYVERFFTLVFLSGTAFYIHKLWNLIFSENKEIAKNSWLPILFWITMPVCFWAYINNVEEVVMSFFALGSVYYSYVVLSHKKQVVLNITLAGIFLFLSSLTKGVQGLFPLVTIAFFWLTTKEVSFKKAFLYSLGLLAVVVAIYGFLLLTNEAVYESYFKYFESRLVSTFNNDRVTDGRFYLLRRLLMELSPMLFTTVIVLFVFKKKKKGEQKIKKNLSIWLLLTGLSGALPLMATLEQRGFYLVTTLPFFSIAIAMWLAPKLSVLIKELKVNAIGFKVFKVVSLLLFISSIVFTVLQVGKMKRYGDFLPDIYTFGDIIPKGEIVNVNQSIAANWGVSTTMIRYNYISLYHGPNQYKYFIIKKDANIEALPIGYERVPLETITLDLYINKEIKETK